MNNPQPQQNISKDPSNLSQQTTPLSVSDTPQAVIPMPPTVIASSPEIQPQRVNPTESLVIPSEQEPIIHPEVREAGVSSVPKTPPITQEQKNVGIQPAKETTVVSTEPTGKIKLPIPESKAEEIIKNDKDTQDSAVWLATVIIRELHAQAIRESEEKES